FAKKILRIVTRQVINMRGAGLAAAFHQSHDLHLFAATKPAEATHENPGSGIVTALATDTGIIGFDSLAIATERPRIIFTHRLSDSMRQEPRALVGDAERPM